MKIYEKPVLLKGYHPAHNPGGVYKIAKIPCPSSVNFTKPDCKAPDEIDCDNWIAAKGWIGHVVPEGCHVLDVEDPVRIDLIRGLLKKKGLIAPVNLTNNGVQFIFSINGGPAIPGADGRITRMGFPVTDRAAKKNYIILPPTNGRTFENEDKLENPPVIPDELLPSRNNVEDTLNALAWALGDAHRKNTLAGYDDLDAGFMALLIECDISEEQILEAYQLTFLNDFNEKRTLTMYQRTKDRKEVDEPLHGIGSLVNSLKEKGLDSIVSLITKLQKLSDKSAPANGITGKYLINNDGTFLSKFDKKGTPYQQMLSNFSAKIEQEIIEDNGVETSHQYHLAGSIQGWGLPSVSVPASNFASMNWLHKWGTKAILEPGQSTKDYLRHAIQVLSTDVVRSHVYTHTGWRQIADKWVYLTGCGAIGADDVRVSLPDSLNRYSLPAIPLDEIEAIKTSLSFLDMGNKQITFPLYAAAFMAPLTTILNPQPNFSIYAYGDTGTFKTTTCQLALCHFGDFSLAGNFSSFDDTSNAIERKAFTLKDTLMLLDDFHPSARKQDAQGKEQIAQRIIRAFSNRTARDRLNSDSTEKGRYSPRGMLLITGEEIVGLQSTLARILVLEFCESDIDISKLSALQARAHQLPHAMSSYIGWLRENITDMQHLFPDKFREYRTRATKEDGHKKMAEQVAFLQFSIDTMLQWVMDRGDISESRAKELSLEAWSIFIELSKKQQTRISDEDPIKRFNAILEALISQGTVTIHDKENCKTAIGGNNVSSDLIGYFDSLNWYLLPVPLWHNIQRYCLSEGTHFPLTKNTFYNMLGKRGLIELGPGGRHTVAVRIGAGQKRVLKFIGRGMSKTEVTDEE